MTSNPVGGTSGPLRFGYDFNPPPGPGGFGGAPPPPPGYLQPTPLGPGAPPGTPTWIYFLFGCGCLLLVAVVGAVGCGWYAVAKLPQLMAGAGRLGKTEYLAQLSADHTAEQRGRFEFALDALNDNTAGFTSFLDYLNAPNQSLYESLNAACKDGSVTVEESQNWAGEVENALNLDSPDQEPGDAPAGEAGEETGAGPDD